MNLKDRRRDTNLRSRYGITLAEYKAIHKKQKGKCKICGKPQSQLKKRLDVDHDHKTGSVRGLLCPYCNRKLLKYLRDDRKKAAGLILYLQGWLNEES